METAAGLRELIEKGVRHMPGCQYAGITTAPHAYEIFQKKQDGAVKVMLKP